MTTKPSADAVLPGDFSVLEACRVCGAGGLETLLDLGTQPLANALRPDHKTPEKRIPLTILFCSKCSLVQLRETVRKELLFSHYVWLTGTSSTARDFAQAFCKRVIDVVRPAADDLIVELASNDGTFLKPFQENGYKKVLGVDPAANIVEAANKAGVRTVCRFWNKLSAEDVAREHGGAKVVIARNVLPHVSELHEFADGIRIALSDDGAGVIEFHDAGEILRELHYDSIYHEHLCFFSLRSVTRLLESHGLFAFHADRSPISGGGYTLFVAKAKRPHSPALDTFIAAEEKAGTNTLESWKRFGLDAQRHREKSLEMVVTLPQPVVGFGASARSSTYLNFCGFNSRQILAVIDNNPLKEGLLTPGSSIPIVSFEQGLAMKPETLFVLAWNFKDEILRDCRARGYKGGYLLPFPRDPYRA
jgi:hypothetical protein